MSSTPLLYGTDSKMAPTMVASASDTNAGQLDTGVCEGAKPYMWAIITIVCFMLLALFLFDVTGQMNKRIFSNDYQNDPEQFRLKSLYMEIGGWGAVVSGGMALGFSLGRKATLGNIEFFESKLTKCPGVAYLTIMILIVILIMVVTYLNDPFDIWHKWSYGNINTDDPCDARLYEKHKKDFEIGGWAAMIMGSIFIGLMTGYVHFYGRKRIKE